MFVSISRPDLLMIADERTDGAFFGGNQDWYASEWSRRAGCGPTCAANILAYLALSSPELRTLYGGEAMNRAEFALHMEAVYQCVTPGNMGLNHTEMLVDGVVNFALSRGIQLTPHAFIVSGNMARNRPPASAFAAFAQAGLAADCPLAFLNLAKGKVKNLQGWHWITITTADIGKNSLITSASDEGRQINFDLRLWYLTTRLCGGLVYFTHETA